MTIKGLTAFCSYIMYIYFRWVRVTIGRYGLRGVLSPSYRPRRAGMGTGRRIKPWQVSHRNSIGGIPAQDLIRSLRIERGLVA